MYICIYVYIKILCTCTYLFYTWYSKSLYIRHIVFIYRYMCSDFLYCICFT